MAETAAAPEIGEFVYFIPSCASSCTFAVARCATPIVGTGAMACLLQLWD